MESIKEIAQLATDTKTTEAAKAELDRTDGWAELTEMVNDPRMFVIDREYTVEEVKQELA